MVMTLEKSTDYIQPHVPRKYAIWSVYEKRILIDNYDGTYNSIVNIRELIPDRTLKSIRYQVYNMRLGKKTDRIPQVWSVERVELLKEMLEYISVPAIAEHFGVSIVALKSVIQRYSLSSMSRYGWYACCDLVNILNVDRKWVIARINNGTLKASKRDWGSYGMYIISEDALFNFIDKYPAELDYKRLNFGILYDIIKNKLKPINGVNGNECEQ